MTTMLSICKSKLLFNKMIDLTLPSRSLGGADGWSESVTGGKPRSRPPFHLFSYVDSCCIPYCQKGESGHSCRVSCIFGSTDTLLINFQRKRRLHPQSFAFAI